MGQRDPENSLFVEFLEQSSSARGSISRDNIVDAHLSDLLEVVMSHNPRRLCRNETCRIPLGSGI